MLLSDSHDLVVGKLYKYLSAAAELRLFKTQQDLEDSYISYVKLVYPVGSIWRNDVVVAIEFADIKDPSIRKMTSNLYAIRALTTNGVVGWGAVKLHHWSRVVGHE